MNHRHKLGPVIIIDPTKWDPETTVSFREKSSRLGEDLIRKNPAPNEVERRMALAHLLLLELEEKNG